MGEYFPDKEKDYQFSSELPPLKVPADISSRGLEKRQPTQRSEEDSETLAVMGEVVKAAPVLAGTVAAPVVVTEQQKPEPVHVELVKFSNGETRLQINKSVAMSWRMVAKALSRKAIEITARDQANSEFRVQYDPNESDFKDDNFWDEITFVFGKDHSQEKPYHLKLLARDKTTEVVVLDEQEQPLAEGGGLSLLKLLATTLQADLADE
jgi:outer membrane protein assembly factor BamC